jgi:hypothetical protein
VHLHATDVEGEWSLRIGPDNVLSNLGHEDSDCAVGAPASDLDLLLWSRHAPDGLDVRGGASIFDFWRDTVNIRWGGER